MTYGGAKEAARLHRIGYPSEGQLADAALTIEHEKGRHVERRDLNCPVCRYIGRTRRI